MKIVSITTLIIVAVSSVVIGIFIASSLNLSSTSQAALFWDEGAKEKTPITIIPSFSELAKKAKPAVVNIRTTKVIHSEDMFKRFYGPKGKSDRFEDFFNKFFNNLPNKDMRQKSLGSGFIISGGGYILTNYHVIAGAEKISISLADKREFEAKVVGKDEKTDIALIKIDTHKEDLPTVGLGDSDSLNIGDWVIAIGNPFGLGHTVTQGIVSAKARIIGAGPYDNFIQTDAAINPGNSGGPLINMKGQVVGINTAIVATGQGIGFALPINMAKNILPELKETGSVTRGWLGVAIQQVTPEIARAVGLKGPKGAIVSMVYPGDPADKAGIKKGDVILKINSREVKDSYSLTRLIAGLKPESKVKIVVWRDKHEVELTTKLEKRTDKHVASLYGRERKSEETQDKLGLKLKEITPEISQRYNLKDTSGIFVAGIDPKGSASSSNIRQADIIKEINGHQVKDVADYMDVLHDVKKGDTVLLLVQRGSSPLYVAIDVN
ncbi:MAG: Do family serine endopeptidase [Thermodesulfobacteriota bacterium]|nr:Do family serine endopeptidase [Thermodesulfobacteriota bacterium]